MMLQRRKGESALETIGCLAVIILVVGGIIWYLTGKNPIAWVDSFKNSAASDSALSFSITVESGVIKHQFEVENETTGGELTDVEVQLTFHPESGSPVEVKESWINWEKGQKKKVSVTADRYKRVEFKGTAKHAGKDVTIDTSWTWKKPISIPSLRGFSSSFDYGPVRFQLNVENETTEGELTDVEALFTFLPESGSPVEVKESWANWEKGQKKKVSVRADRYKRVEIKGTAKIAGKEVTINSYWTWDKPYRPAVTDFGASIRESGTLTFTNKCQAGTLRNVQVTISLTRSDGVKHSFDATWAEWHWEGTKEMSVPGNRYGSYTIKGRASIDGVEVEIDDSGTWSWK